MAISDVPFKPTKEQLLAASDKVVPDVMAKDLDVVFCGINPGLYTGAVGHHFARPGNRFWKALYGSGFTDRLYSPFEDRRLLDVGIGITNVVQRTTASAAELSKEELREGATRLSNLVKRYRPSVLAVLGLGAYTTAFGVRAVIGPQDHPPVNARVYVLPNPSGLQARYQLPELIELFSDLKGFVSQKNPG